jgi:hypothetical protein
MSVNAYNKLTTGTPISWKPSGGDFALILTSLANAAARQGAKGDLGAFWAQRWAVLLTTSLAVAGTNGNAVEIYWAASFSSVAGTDNPGGASGADASFGTPAEYKLQLLSIGSLAIVNNAGTGIQKYVTEFCPPTRYGMPVIVNSSGQALGSTAGDHEFRISPAENPQTTTVTG